MSREGPSVSIRFSCGGCAYEKSTYYAVQGDSGFDIECTHPRVGRRDIPDRATPHWCPVWAEGLLRAHDVLAQLGLGRRHG